MDAATRARLEDPPFTRLDAQLKQLGEVRIDDIFALLAAYDHAIANLVEVHDRWGDVEVERDALRAAQAQAAPVLAAVPAVLARLEAECWHVYHGVGKGEVAALVTAYASWRAAREG